MKDIYYGDKRDIVKWGGIVHLCTTSGIKKVIQVAYYRPDQRLKEIHFDGQTVSISETVSRHFFKDIEDIKRLSSEIGVMIQVVKIQFNHATRKLYHDEISQIIKRVKEHKVVFLDPDTGLNSVKASAIHVQPEELHAIWQSLNPKDFLVFYQHAPHFAGWRETKRSEFAAACEVQLELVKEWQSDEVSDVIIFFIEK
jgi:hypothetical protein